MCLAQVNNTVTLARLQPAAPRSRVKHSTTALPCKNYEITLHFFSPEDAFLLAVTFVTFANSLDPDQDLQNVRPDLDLNCLTLRKSSLKIFLLKVNFEKLTDDNKSMKSYP